MILITGAHKAFALYKAVEEGVNHMWTVSAVQQHPRALLICDEDATLELKVKTVKYFKVIVHFRTDKFLWHFTLAGSSLLSFLWNEWVVCTMNWDCTGSLGST
jgi:hypothetical protein